MSSSRRSLQNERCPSCGATAIETITEDLVLKVGRKRVRVKAVSHERCRACGERIFDLDTSRRFDAVVLARRTRAA